MPERTYPCCACCAADLPHIERDMHTLPCDICHPSPVQRALMAIAWDEGVAAMTQAVVLAREGRTSEARAAILPNPYRAAHAAAHSAAQGVPASQCGPDAARPADGIVRGTHYGTEGGER